MNRPELNETGIIYCTEDPVVTRNQIILAEKLNKLLELLDKKVGGGWAESVTTTWNPEWGPKPSDQGSVEPGHVGGAKGPTTTNSNKTVTAATWARGD